MVFITDKTELKRFYAEKRLWQGIPSIERTNGGRLFATFYSGGYTEDYGNFCVVIQSDDDGKTWSEPIAAAYNGENSRCFDSQLWLDPLGRLWFTWAQYPENTLTAVICGSPDAEDLEWGEERVIGEGVMMQKPTVLKSGEWLFPIAVWKEETNRNISKSIGRECKAFVYSTYDNGKNFTKIGGADDPDSSVDEHSIVELNDGRLMMYIRTFHGLSTSYSWDGGKTWSKPVPCVHKNPSARVALRRLKSGNILLVNHYEFTWRNNLTAFISCDDGLTWQGGLMIDSRDEVSYPDITEDENGLIYIIYDHERGNYRASVEIALKDAREILLAKVTEADILAKELVDPRSELEIVISKLTEYTGEDIYQRENREAHEAFVGRLMQMTDVNCIAVEIFAKYGTNCATFTKQKSDELDIKFGMLADITLDNFAKHDIIEEIIGILSSNSGANADTSYECTAGRDNSAAIGMITDHIRRNLRTDITLDGIAEAVHLSRYYICYLFKKQTGITPFQYLLELRIAEAKRLLSATDEAVNAIAERVGFNNTNYFNRVFRVSVGLTPTEYRSNTRNTVL